MKKIASRKDSALLADFIDLIGDMFNMVLEFISNPEEKPKPRKHK